MQSCKKFSATERRIFSRKHISGEVTFRNGEYYMSCYKDYCQDGSHGKALCGKADVMDKSRCGMRIKTDVPLKKGYILKIMNPEIGIAMVRWVEKDDDCYYAGLMFNC